ncbi:hypothetical protein CMETHOX_15480 [Lacrimispora indolis]|nr:hypothetical protein CMETHOX_15480 [[Clostridium] methoxybenzovorans]
MHRVHLPTRKILLIEKYRFDTWVLMICALCINYQRFFGFVTDIHYSVMMIS